MPERCLDVPRTADELLHDVLLGLFGQPEKVARPVHFLLSPVLGL
jgi:NAD(P)-dependent dehydrogenase (short-subunit alcohol dehydrogenase family)